MHKELFTNPIAMVKRIHQGWTLNTAMNSRKECGPVWRTTNRTNAEGIHIRRKSMGWTDRRLTKLPGKRFYPSDIKDTSKSMQTCYLVFNGDADGICAAHQFYLSRPVDFVPVTGVKRDIALLKKIRSPQDDIVSVFDISMEKNLPELENLLNNGCAIHWFDHHVSDSLPRHGHLTCHIDTSPLVNTSFLVSQYLDKPSSWAIVGLCGDNMSKTAEGLAKKFNLSSSDYSRLNEAGELLNYNAYGESTADLHIHPADLLSGMAHYADPLDYIHDTSTVDQLRDGMKADLSQAKSTKAITEGVFIFPNEKWARRVIGVFANRSIRENPDTACAVLIEKKNSTSFVVSVRSPLYSKRSAATLCKQFPTGGGRVKAAGINQLPHDHLSLFIEGFKKFYAE